jgi:hypothetical protein
LREISDDEVLAYALGCGSPVTLVFLREAVRSVPCPLCDAAAGQKCKRKRGRRPRVSNHLERIYASIRQAIREEDAEWLREYSIALYERDSEAARPQ